MTEDRPICSAMSNGRMHYAPTQEFCDECGTHRVCGKKHSKKYDCLTENKARRFQVTEEHPKRYWRGLDELETAIYDALNKNDSFEVLEQDPEYRSIQIEEMQAIYELKDLIKDREQEVRRETVEEVLAEIDGMSSYARTTHFEESLAEITGRIRAKYQLGEK